MTSRNLTTGRFVKTTVFNECFFECIDTEEKAYWLGFLYADGNITDSHVLQLSLSEKDKLHIDSFIQALDSDAKSYSYVKKDKYKDRTIISCQHRSKKMAEHLALLGLVPRKTKIAKVPNISPSLQPHFFRGYFDGDGSVFKTKNNTKSQFFKLSMNIIGNHFFVEQMQNILIEHLGVNKTKLNIPKHSPEMAYMIYSGTPQVKRIASWMYHDATIWLPRKRERFNVE